MELTYQLPLTLSGADSYFVEAYFGDAYTTSPFTVLPLFEYELILPEHVKEGEGIRVELTIINRQEVALKDIQISPELPLEIEAMDDLERQVPELSPGARETFVWNLAALSRSVIAPLKFIITSENGGGMTISQGVVIDALAIPEKAPPIPAILLELELIPSPIP